MDTHVTKQPARSDLGTVRKLPSGRYQASFRTNGERFTAPHTFRTKDDARGWLAMQSAVAMPTDPLAWVVPAIEAT